MSWERVKLGDVVSIGRGSSPRPIADQKYFENGNIPWIKIADATASGKLIYETKQCVNEIGASFSRLLKPGSLILAASGTLGFPKILGVRGCIHDGWLYFFDYKEIEKEYLYYLLITLKDYFYSKAYGAAIQNINTDILRDMDIKLPDIGTQQRIVEIISTYDDLIENNQKQIKLFEEAAMRLYKEWFVYLRFPGYENTPIVDGVPEGWEPGRFKDLCSLVKETVKVKDLKIDMPYIGLEHMPRKSICLNEWSDASTVNSNKFRFKENDILFGKIRPYFHKVGFAITNGVASTDAMVFRAKDDMFGLALMTAFSDLFIKHTSTACKEGAKMPRADWNEMKNYEVLIPAQSVLKEYDRQIQSLCSNIKVLCQQVKLLKQARDKLLPKLMRGEIEV